MILKTEIIKVHHINQMNQGSDDVLARLEDCNHKHDESAEI
jgi:hypothetical protein